MADDVIKLDKSIDVKFEQYSNNPLMFNTLAKFSKDKFIVVNELHLENMLNISVTFEVSNVIIFNEINEEQPLKFQT